MPWNVNQKNTACQSESYSTQLIPSLRKEPDNNTFEIISSSRHHTISPSLDSEYMWPQLQVAGDGAKSSGFSACVRNSEVTQVAGSSGGGKTRRPFSGAVGNQNKRRRISNATSPDFHTIPLLYEPECSRYVSECILNLIRMAPNGQGQVSYHLVRSIVNTLSSEVEAWNSFNLRKFHRRASSSYLKIVRNRIESNRIASMEALRLLQSAEIFKIQRPQLKEWSKWESEALFDPLINLPSWDCEPEEPCRIATSSWNDSEANATNYAVLFQHNQIPTHVPRKRRDNIVSIHSKLGRIDIRVSKLSTSRIPEVSNSTAEVTFTPTGAAQLRFSLQQQVTQEASILLTPTLSIRNTIPDDSEIFEIAAYGTVEKLWEMFSCGKASPLDCDTNGRSLINVSIRLPLTRIVTETH
jgi:hypothetical protein